MYYALTIDVSLIVVQKFELIFFRTLPSFYNRSRTSRSKTETFQDYVTSTTFEYTLSRLVFVEVTFITGKEVALVISSSPVPLSWDMRVPESW